MIKKLLLSALLVAPAMCALADEAVPVALLPEGVTINITGTLMPQKPDAGGLVVAGSPAAGYKAYFFATTGEAGSDEYKTGPDLWATDGTPEGTYRVKDLRTKGTAASNAKYLTRFGDKVLFTCADGVHGNQPWISDGTPEGTHMLKDMCSGSNGYQSHARGYTQVNENLAVFASQVNVTTANNKDTDFPLYLIATDGTEEGTNVIAEIKCQWPGKASDNNARVDNWCRVGRKVFFKAISLDGLSGEELWVTDGTAEGTKMVKDINVSTTADHTTSAVAFFTNYYNEQLIFRAYKSPYSHEPWISDGTEEGTKMIYDIHPDKNGNGAMAFPTTNFTDSYVYFRCTTPETGSEFGRINIDAFLAGETNVFEIFDVNTTEETASNASSPGPSMNWKDRVWFSANGGTGIGGELFMFDTNSNTVSLFANMEPEGDFWPKELTVCAGSLYFYNAGAGKTVNKSALWRIDDPESGTMTQVTNFDGNAHNVMSLRNLDGTMLFAANPTGSKQQLYAYDYRKPDFDKVTETDAMEPEYRTRAEIKVDAVENVLAEKAAPKATVTPNPASDVARINVAGEILAVSVYNMQGAEVLTANSANLNVAGLAAGMYLVRVTTDGGEAVARLIKK